MQPALANTSAATLCPPSFPDSTIREVGANPSDIEVRDLDGDSIPDLAVVARYPNAVSVLRGLGNGTFGPEERYEIGQISSGLEIGDIDSDGYADMVVTMDFVAHLGVFWGRPDGGFDSLATYPAVGLFSLNVADMDGDGRDDVVYTTERENAVTVIWGNGTRTLEERTSYPAPITPFFVALGDMNGDHLPDLGMNGGDGIVYGAMNLGQRQFGSATTALACSLSALNFSFGNLNGDAFEDLVVLASSSLGTATVGIGRGDGGFDVFPVSFPGSFPKRVKVADLNGDGNGDLVVGCQSSQDARLLLGHGDGTFDYLTRLHGENCVADVEARDLNRDGSPDVVILAGCSYMLSIFPNAQTHTAGSVRFAPIVYAKGQRSTPLVAQVVLPTGTSHQWDSSSVSLLWRGAVLGTAFSAYFDSASGAATYTFGARTLDAIPPGDQTLTVVGCDSTGAVFRARSEMHILAAVRRMYWQASRPGSLPIAIQFAEPQAPLVAYRVYDCRGREVRRGSAVVAESGLLIWDARSSQGRSLASGIYLFKPEGHETSCKVVVLR